MKPETKIIEKGSRKTSLRCGVEHGTCSRSVFDIPELVVAGLITKICSKKDSSV